MNRVKYSIIMPCFNEAHVLERSLSSIRSAIADRSDVEMLLLDNGSADDSVAVAEKFGAQVYSLPGVRISALRNQGARLSQGKYLLFLDADIQVPANWLDKIDSYADQGAADVVGFVDTVPDTAPWFAKTWGLRASARRSTLRAVDSLPGRNLFVSRRWFDTVDGFSEDLTTGEDKDFVMRLKKAGAVVLSDPSLDMIHLGYERTFREWCRKEYWRQHSHIAIMSQQGINLRLLRFPLISLAHVIWALLIVLLVAGGYGHWSLVLLWLVPALAMSLANPLSRWPAGRLARFTLLYWLRFHIAGISVIREFMESRKRSPA
ncbi:MAG: glycosyltransferase [Ketobacteraceae bacterium]|nr:glycosyltransferase [Ketobacteraceae bacterium]